MFKRIALFDGEIQAESFAQRQARWDREAAELPGTTQHAPPRYEQRTLTTQPDPDLSGDADMSTDDPDLTTSDIDQDVDYDGVFSTAAEVDNPSPHDMLASIMDTAVFVTTDQLRTIGKTAEINLPDHHYPHDGPNDPENTYNPD